MKNEPIYLIDAESGNMICITAVDYQQRRIITTNTVVNIYTQESVQRYNGESYRQPQYNKQEDKWYIRTRGTNNTLISFLIPRHISDNFPKPKRIKRVRGA